MPLKFYKAPLAKGSFNVDKSGLMFVAGILFVTIIAIILTLALGVEVDSDGSMPFTQTTTDLQR
jgi:hypothetical protein